MEFSFDVIESLLNVNKDISLELFKSFSIEQRLRFLDYFEDKHDILSTLLPFIEQELDELYDSSKDDINRTRLYSYHYNPSSTNLFKLYSSFLDKERFVEIVFADTPEDYLPEKWESLLDITIESESLEMLTTFLNYFRQMEDVQELAIISSDKNRQLTIDKYPRDYRFFIYELFQFVESREYHSERAYGTIGYDVSKCIKRSVKGNDIGLFRLFLTSQYVDNEKVFGSIVYAPIEFLKAFYEIHSKNYSADLMEFYASSGNRMTDNNLLLPCSEVECLEFAKIFVEEGDDSAFRFLIENSKLGKYPGNIVVETLIKDKKFLSLAKIFQKLLQKDKFEWQKLKTQYPLYQQRIEDYEAMF